MKKTYLLIDEEKTKELIESAVEDALQKFQAIQEEKNNIYPLNKLQYYFASFKTKYQKLKLKEAIERGDTGFIDAEGRLHISHTDLLDWLNAGRK